MSVGRYKCTVYSVSAAGRTDSLGSLTTLKLHGSIQFLSTSLLTMFGCWCPVNLVFMKINIMQCWLTPYFDYLSLSTLLSYAGEGCEVQMGIPKSKVVPPSHIDEKVITVLPHLNKIPAHEIWKCEQFQNENTTMLNHILLMMRLELQCIIVRLLSSKSLV